MLFRVLPTPFPGRAIGEEWSEPKWLIVRAWYLKLVRCVVPVVGVVSGTCSSRLILFM